VGYGLSGGACAMTDIELAELAGWLIGSWCLGYGFGFTVLHIRKFVDKI